MNLDKEKLEMQDKLQTLINENYIYYDNKKRDFVAAPKDEDKPECYDKWHKSHLRKIEANMAYKADMKQKIYRAKCKCIKANAPIYVCEHCSFTTQTCQPQTFNRFHNENCKENKINQKETNK